MRVYGQVLAGFVLMVLGGAEMAKAQANASILSTKQFSQGVQDREWYTDTGDDLKVEWRTNFSSPLAGHLFSYKMYVWDDTGVAALPEETSTVSVAQGSSVTLTIDVEFDASDINANISHGACCHIYNSASAQLDSEGDSHWDVM